MVRALAPWAAVKLMARDSVIRKLDLNWKEFPASLLSNGCWFRYLAVTSYAYVCRSEQASVHEFAGAYKGQRSTLGIIPWELSTLVFETEPPIGSWSSLIRLA